MLTKLLSSFGSTNKTNYLDLTPVRKQNYEMTTDGKVFLLVPKFKNKSWGRILLPKGKPQEIAVKLDDIGSKVWLKIDGSSTVADICSQLVGEIANEDLAQMEIRLTKFFDILFNNKYISFKELN
jgi:hypothetical protein